MQAPRCEYRDGDRRCFRVEGHRGDHELGPDQVVVDPDAKTVVIRVRPWWNGVRRLWRAVWRVRR